MTTQHTPGPWNMRTIPDDSQDWRLSYWIDLPNGAPIADVRSRPDNEAEPNARLIAAAPDLLEACKYVVQYHREHDSGEGELFGLDFVTTCIAAIRKVDPEWRLTK